MNALFRHLSVRLWLTALAGGFLCLTLLPWWQQFFGLRWPALPAIAILGACFGAVGWIMNRVGIAAALRQVNEAAVWERAGMIREAQSALQRSASCFDSFWLSPFSRRRKTRWLSSALARFYLSQFAESPYTRSLLADYLKHYPQDETVAETWLEGLVSREQCSDQEYEAVARVGGVLDHHKPIQRLLMQFYMANGRVDFDAQQTYRRVWKEQQPLAGHQVHALARLLRNESIISPWALQVYLKAYQTGEADAIEGIVAGLRLLPVSEENRQDLETARHLVAGLDPEKVHRLNARIKPVEIEPILKPPRRTNGRPAPLVFRAVKVVESVMVSKLKPFQKIFAVARGWIAGLEPRHWLYALGICGAGGLVLFVILSGRQAAEPPGPEPPVVQTAEEKPAPVDPFTIQVAAYLKAEDAQRFVDRLILQKLDAYWTKAKSASRTWYQVKVSHFPTREAAQQYGQDLKSKGLIDDFYVANYQPR